MEKGELKEWRTVRPSDHRTRAWLPAVTGLLACVAPPGGSAGPAAVTTLERDYQAFRYWRDQLNVTVNRLAATSLTGVSAETLRVREREARERFGAELAAAPSRVVPSADSTALAAMQSAWEGGLSTPPEEAGDSASPPPCDYDAASLGEGPGGLERLTGQVLACYGAAASRIVVDGDTLNRLAVLELVSRLDDPARRRRLFLALDPVWHSVNGADEGGSPYRTMLRRRSDAWAREGSPIDAKGPAFGIPPDSVEAWLVSTLERWRELSPDTLLEPWDWLYRHGALARRFEARLPGVPQIRAVNDSFYRALGADPASLGIHYDLAAWPGKYPVAFTDFGARGRWEGGRWLPAEPWVFASYLGGGLDNLAELLHETGHAVHIAAIRGRPAFVDWPDNDTFTEALADVPAVELYEPSWQLRFLGDSATLAESLESRYAGVMFDIAWGLFEIRVHRDPASDPNAVWTDLTTRYFRIRPHPEWSWWAMRGQLIDAPGYLVNYALGAFITADLRARLNLACGGCTRGDPGYYPVASALLYRFGLERSSRRLLEEFLGRPLRPDALWADLERATR